MVTEVGFPRGFDGSSKRLKNRLMQLKCVTTCCLPDGNSFRPRHSCTIHPLSADPQHRDFKSVWRMWK